MALIQDNHVVKQVCIGNYQPSAQQHRSATDCERSCELAGFRCPSLPKPRRLQTLRLDRIARICVAVCRPMLLAIAVQPKEHWDLCHIEMQDLTPFVADDEKAVQNTKSERWDDEKVHRSNGLAMVSEERQPSLHRVWISRGSPDPSRDTPFREIETQLEQFAVNARRSPGWILSNHTEDQGANLLADTLRSSYLADSGDSRPIQTKSGSMPVHDGSRSDQDERLPPPGPAHSQRNPKQFVQDSQSTARSLRVQSQQLPTESQVFEDEVRPTTERTDQPAEEMPERHDHGKNFSGKDRINLCAKSLISQVYDLLARHRDLHRGPPPRQSARRRLSPKNPGPCLSPPKQCESAQCPKPRRTWAPRIPGARAKSFGLQFYCRTWHVLVPDRTRRRLCAPQRFRSAELAHSSSLFTDNYL